MEIVDHASDNLRSNLNAKNTSENIPMIVYQHAGRWMIKKHAIVIGSYNASGIVEDLAAVPKEIDAISRAKDIRVCSVENSSVAVVEMDGGRLCCCVNFTSVDQHIIGKTAAAETERRFRKHNHVRRNGPSLVVRVKIPSIDTVLRLNAIKS